MAEIASTLLFGVSLTRYLYHFQEVMRRKLRGVGLG